MKALFNVTRGTVICSHVAVADKPVSRMRGLLGRDSLPPGEGLLLMPAPSVHTAFMRFPIDVVFLDRTMKVVKVVTSLPPWRATSARRARATLELAANEAAAHAIAIGDELRYFDAWEASTIDVGSGPAVAHARGPHILLAAPDRRFRAVAATLLAERGCTLVVSDGMSELARQAAQTRADVVIIDTSSSQDVALHEAACIAARRPRIGVVLVGDEPVRSMRVIAKWGSFDALYDAAQAASPRP